MLGAYGIGRLGSSLLGGVWTDRHGHRFVIAVSMFSSAAGMLVLGWLTALYPAISTPENVLQLGTTPRVVFNVAYTALVLSNPTAALIPVLIWGALLRREMGEILIGESGPPGAGPMADKRR